MPEWAQSPPRKGDDLWDMPAGPDLPGGGDMSDWGMCELLGRQCGNESGVGRAPPKRPGLALPHQLTVLIGVPGNGVGFSTVI